MSKNTRNRILLTAVAAMLLVTLTVGGTLAWLTATTNTVTNTFSATGIEIILDESKLVKDKQTGEYELNTTERVTGNAYPLIPGNSYPKDPTVKVVGKANNVDVYLFVKFEEIGNPATYLTYTSALTTANGWTQGNGTDIPTNVWYREVPASTADQSWVLLTAGTDGNAVTIKDTVDQNNMATAAAASLKYDAWAVQQDNLTVEAAWAALNVQ